MFKRYLLRDIKYLIEESECGINVDIGMDGPVESPPPGLRPLVRTKTTQFYANPTTPWYNSPASSTICKYIYMILSKSAGPANQKKTLTQISHHEEMFWGGWGLILDLIAYYLI